MERPKSKLAKAFSEILETRRTPSVNEQNTENLHNPIKSVSVFENDTIKTHKSELPKYGNVEQLHCKDFSMKKLEHKNNSMNPTVSQFQTLAIHAKSTSDNMIENEPEHTRKLFVGNLDKVTTEDNLKYYFIKFGAIENTFILRYPNSKRSASIGYILFQQSCMVTKAYASAQHEIDDRKLTLSLAKEDGSDPEQFCTLFMQGLSHHTTERDVVHHFKRWGIVKNITLKSNHKNSTKCGCVTFKYSYMMINALSSDSHEINGRNIALNMSIRKWHGLEPACSRKIIVENLNADTTERTLNDNFQRYGKIESCIIFKEPLTDQSECVGYVLFEKAQSLSAIKVPSYHEIDKRKVLVLVQWKVSREAENCRKLIIENLNNETSENTLIHYFKQFGKVETCVIARENISRRSRGFGYLVFEKTSAIYGVFQNQPHLIDNKELMLTFPNTDNIFFGSVQRSNKSYNFQKDKGASSSNSQVDGKPFQQKNRSTSSNSSQVGDKSSINGTVSISSRNAQKDKRSLHNQKKHNGKEMMKQWEKSQMFKSKEYSLNDFDGAGVNIFSK